MKCTNCQTENRSASKFCKACGAQMSVSNHTETQIQEKFQAFSEGLGRRKLSKPVIGLIIFLVTAGVIAFMNGGQELVLSAFARSSDSQIDSINRASQSSSTNSDYSQFSGAWFEITVPPNFTVVPSLKSSSAEGYESAFFRSPDSKVEFYIFSPQWNGEPTDIEVNPMKESVTSSNVSSSETNIVTWITIRANDGSYTRTYQDTKSIHGSVRWTIGIKYASQGDYDQYKNEYLKFKNSLVQYADGM